MKTRRGFLTALGLGAGATTWALTGTARAWGRRRRRSSTTCSQCGSQTLQYTSTGCACACPQYLYAQVNGIYYYYCNCCNGNVANGNVIASSSAYIQIPSGGVPCGNSLCIGACNRSPTPLEKVYANHDIHDPYDDCGFHLDPKALVPAGLPQAPPPYPPNPAPGTQLDIAFIKGIKVQSFAELGKQIGDNPNVISGASKVTAVDRVKYLDGSTPRYVALYDITSTNANGCPLHIGIEISDTPPATAPSPDEWGIPFASGFSSYHHVYYKNHRYHTVTKPR
jgi:hypothetical protein